MSATIADPREQILTRLAVVLGTIANARVYRNTLEIPEERYKLGPVIAMLDADETTDDSAYGRGRPASGAVVVSMRPEIFAGSMVSDNPGTESNTLRGAIVRAVLTDQELLSLCKDGDIRYEGATTAFAQGRSMLCSISVGFAFNYVLRPAQIQT